MRTVGTRECVTVSLCEWILLGNFSISLGAGAEMHAPRAGDIWHSRRKKCRKLQGHQYVMELAL